ncbi:MAG: condensation domain-containing protein, partial [Rhodanobacteraceae bacterium]
MEEVVDSFELSPMQEGMLFHAVSASDPGIDIEQIVISLAEPFDLARFESTWREIQTRHAILRTRFRWNDVAAPRQEVLASAPIPISVVDWRYLPHDEAEARFASHLSADRTRGFDLAAAPSMRLFVARLPADSTRVLWTFHHALLDGRSFAIVLREWFAVHDAPAGGEMPTFAPARPFRDYIAWRRTLDMAAAEAFWREQLAGFHAPTPFGIDGLPKEHSADAFGAREVRLDRAASDRVRAAAARENVTVNTLLQAAWAVLLRRYGGESDIVFGATRAGRSFGFDDAGEMVGLFINTLPMRVAIDDSAPVATLLRALREQQAALRAYEHTPLAAVQGWSAVARGTALFESAVVYDHASLDARMRTGAEDRGRRFEYIGQTSFPLTLIAYGDDQLLLRLEYSKRRFGDAAIERMLGHLAALLEGLADADGKRVCDLVMTSAAERARLVGGEPLLPCAPGNSTLHAGFEREVARDPAAIAVSFEDESGRVDLSYGELDRRATTFARHLLALGVRPGHLVGIRTERNANLVVAVLAILKAGAAYLPLDPVYPTERIAFMLSDAEVDIVLTQRSRVDELATLPVRCICLDGEAPDVEGAPMPAPGASGDPAYVIYTSGSTGQPKGVRITHHNVVRLLTSTAHWYG